MKFTVWQRKPVPAKKLADDVEELDIQLVHWTGTPSEDPGTECRVVTIQVNSDGGVTVEHSTTEYAHYPESGFEPEHITRFYIPGWEE